MKKILVIDNDEDMLRVVDVVLSNHDFVVKTISKWQNISKAIKSFAPDLILLDIDLGGVDGGEICKKLKESGEVKSPVILISAIMPEDYSKVSDAQGYLTKPFQISSLINTINFNLN